MRSPNLRWRWTLAGTALLAVAGYFYWRLAVPVHRVSIRSELVMLGDLDADHAWAGGDLKVLEALLEDPFAMPADVAWRLDLNQNGLVDREDLAILRALVAAMGDPYAAEAARPQGSSFPRPRELYRYVSVAEYRPRPLWTLPYPAARGSVLRWLEGFQPSGSGPYTEALELAIRDEAIRFDRAYRRREAALLPIEREYAARKIARLDQLHGAGERYELLLALIELVEDAETLSAPHGPDFTLQLLVFRDHLREVLSSPLFAEFAAGRQD